jgi:hypothetical protein
MAITVTARRDLGGPVQIELLTSAPALPTCIADPETTRAAGYFGVPLRAAAANRRQHAD